MIKKRPLWGHLWLTVFFQLVLMSLCDRFIFNWYYDHFIKYRLAEFLILPIAIFSASMLFLFLLRKCRRYRQVSNVRIIFMQ